MHWSTQSFNEIQCTCETKHNTRNALELKKDDAFNHEMWILAEIKDSVPLFFEIKCY